LFDDPRRDSTIRGAANAGACCTVGGCRQNTMTAMEFTLPALTTEQWRQINALATSLKPDQALWISGYFAGIGHQARAAGGLGQALAPSTAQPIEKTGPAASRSLTILYGSETGNSAGLAKSLLESLRGVGLDASVADMADYKVRKFRDERDLLIITSTHGEGDPPLSAKSFFEFIESRKAPRLPETRYAILALGDSTYEQFCGAGKRLDRRLEQLGATCMTPRVDCDVDYEETAAAWIDQVTRKLAADHPAVRSVAAAPLSPASSALSVDKNNPFLATVIDNFVLTGRGSSKETRHIELSLSGSDIAFEPGDALGILPRNDPALVEALLRHLSLSADAPVTVKTRQFTLSEALASAYEITVATPRFIDQWATISGAADLAALRGDAAAERRTAFLRAHHVIDIVRRFPVSGIDAQTFLAGLRPLQPRLYSIASSLTLVPEEAHLTVCTVRYELHGEPRAGVASGQLARRADPETALPVYVQSNPHFRLPADDTSVIMIGAGTGVAPYRAFLQEREARGAAGRSWLLFGDRNFHTDFLYQTEWQGWLKEGVLSRLNVSFSRDQAEKVYVQHRLIDHARDVYAWLEDGAHLYVCGGTHLAPDVHAALSKVVQQRRGCGLEEAAAYLGALQRDHRYQVDVY
jgi:sulfite reductase (NADPH) flavoprotein alpha-component